MKSPKLYRKQILLVLVIAGMMLSLGACAPATLAPEPTCLPDDLVAPTNLWPNDDTSTPGDTLVLDTLTPTFTWELTADCQPDSYTVQINRPFWEDEMSGITATRLETTSWTVDPPLIPGSMYTWQVSAQVGSSLGPASEQALFMTAPLCMDPYASEYPTPILLGPDNGEVITTGSDITYPDETTSPTVSFHMIWDDPAECLPEDGYIIQVSDSPSFPEDTTRTIIFNQDYRTFGLFFFPPDFVWSECVSYYWRVQANLPGENEGPFSPTWSFIVNTHELDCSAIPTATPSNTPEAAFAYLKQNASCRSGPTLDHPILDFLTEGSSYRIDGRNQDSSWWWIFDENINNHCWVSNNLVDVSDAANDTKIITPIPPPVQMPTETPVAGCWVLKPNQQLVCVAPCPANAKPGGACKP